MILDMVVRRKPSTFSLETIMKRTLALLLLRGLLVFRRMTLSSILMPGGFLGSDSG
jgi:hypothetical protein